MTVITWDTGNGAPGEVYLSRNGLPETKLAPPAPTGRHECPWIYSATYVFTLYEGRGHKNALATVTVVREK